MATNTNKRLAVKWIRDLAKKAYEKQDNCFICNTTVDLELHHLHSLSYLLEIWARKNNYDISSDTGVLAIREQFISEHQVEIYDLVYTLCNRHHVQLHSIYGKSPLPSTVGKQERWINAQREKHASGTHVYRGSTTGSFSEFTGDLTGVTKFS